MDTSKTSVFCVNTQKQKCRWYSARSRVVSLDKMAVLEAFHVDSLIVTHASLVNFTWIQQLLLTPPLLISRGFNNHYSRLPH